MSNSGVEDAITLAEYAELAKSLKMAGEIKELVEIRQFELNLEAYVMEKVGLLRPDVAEPDNFSVKIRKICETI